MYVPPGVLPIRGLELSGEVALAYRLHNRLLTLYPRA